MSSVLYELKNVTQKYGEHQALHPVSLTVKAGEVIAFTGPNGSGKSTLLRLLAFLEQPCSGQLSYFGHREDPRKEVTLLLQEPYLLRTTVFQNVTLGLRLRGDTSDWTALYEDCMRAVGFENPQSLAQRGPKALSGGEKQRVALAARLVLQPKVLLLDEPTSNIDAQSARALVAALLDVQQQGTTVICSTHDPALLRSLKAREISLGQSWDTLA